MTHANKNTSITLGEPLNTFIAQQIASGRYGNASEVVRAGLRLLEERESKLTLLRAALEEGRRSPFTADFSLSSLLEKIDSTSR
jgi:antitoxin ParD1/3/4